MATWFITGCSTGLGRALATTALDRGETVVLTARNRATRRGAADAIITAIRSPSPPRLPVLGPDALAWFDRSVDEPGADVDAWRHTSLGTSFPEGS